MIHPTAVIDPKAHVHSTCSVGPYCVLGPDVELGENCELISHVVIHGPAKIGGHNRFFPFCAVGGEPQDLSYTGENTRLEMGSHNVVREFVTINRGTTKGGGVTTIGSHTLLMAYAHVGHDSVIGDHAMLVNGATLAGHVTVEEWAVVGALSAVHQFDAGGSACLYRRRHHCDAGRAAFFQVLRAARSQDLWRELSGPATPRLQ